MGTVDPKTRVVRQIGENQEEWSQEPQEEGETAAVNADMRLSYAFYQLSRMIELKKRGKVLDHLVGKAEFEMRRTV